MSKEIVINKHSLQVKQYNGQNVVTFKEIDLCHERPSGTAGRNFRANKQHFIEGKDYFSVELTTDEIRRQFGISKNAGRTVTLITESGYLMLVKSFTDELSWNVQRMLVNSYFNYKEEKPYEYFDKTYNGEPVLTLEDAEHITGIKANTLNAFLHKYAVAYWDYFVVAKDNLKKFKDENPKVKRLASKILVVTYDGIKAICKFYGLGIDEPKQFAVKKTNEQLTLPDVSEDDTDKMLEQIKASKARTATINTLLEELEKLVAYKNGNEMEKTLYDYYVPSYIRVLGSFQIKINR